MQQIECLAVNPITINNLASLKLHDGRVRPQIQ